MTNTLAAEYPNSGVTFTVVCPFTTRTAFLDGPTSAPIVEKMPKFMVQTPEHVARVSVDAVRRGKTVAHTSLLNHAMAVLLTVAPTRLVIRGLIAYMAMGRDDLKRG